jgi:hypothetical protein
MPPPNRVFISKFVCNGKLSSGKIWGCGAGFIDYTSFYQHLYSEDSGSGCRQPFIEEKKEAEAEDLAKLFAIKCSVDNGPALLGSEATISPSSAQTVIRRSASVPDSAPVVPIDLIWEVLSKLMAYPPS